jgi:helicase HerA-like protein/uncharacterized protein DUF87
VKQLRLSDNLCIPTDAQTQTFAILAKRGSGKTYTAAVLTEELLGAGSQVVVADPIGVWWGLRASANGRDPGLPIVVLGGDHADVPLGVDAGKVIAEFVVETGQSVVLDLSLFRKGEQVRFMTDFAETLYHRSRSPLHLVLDEADAFAPQRPQKGEERMLGAIEDLVRRGRARGIGVTLVTQRAAVLNKNVLTQVEVLVALRTIAPQDRDAMDAWIQAHGTPEERKTFMDSLASLGVGDAWFWSPGWLDIFKRVHVRARQTFDSSATPKAGEAKRTPKKLADVDLAALTKKISATIERAKADDPRELRKKIAERERELKEERAKVQLLLEQIERQPKAHVLDRPLVERIEASARILQKHGLELAQEGEAFATTAEEIMIELRKAQGSTVTRPVAPPSRASVSTVLNRAAPVRIRVDRPANGSLAGGERKILTALAQYPDGRTKTQVAILTGYAHNGGGFNNYLSSLRSKEYIETSGDRLVVTKAGVDALGSFEPLPTGRALLEHWLARVGKAERSALTVLVEAYPRSVDKETLAVAAGYEASGGGFNNALSKLRTLELIAGRGELRASEDLFE